MVDSKGGTWRRVDYNNLMSNMCELNNCSIKNAQRIIANLSSTHFRCGKWHNYELMYHCLLTNQNSGIVIAIARF